MWFFTYWATGRHSLLAVIYNCRRWGWRRFFPKALWMLWIHPGDSLEQMIPSCQSPEFSHSWEVRCVWIQRCYRAQKDFKITADGDCSHKLKRLLLLGSKTMTNLDSILKNRDIILLTKVHMVKAMVFSVVTKGCKSWTVKETECRRTDAFKLWCWRRLLRVPWTARRSNQSFLQEINPEYPLEGLMLKLKLQYFGHLMQRVDSLEKTLMLRKIEGSKRKAMAEDEMGGWHHRLSRHEFEQTPGDSEGQGSLACCSPRGHKIRHND